MGLVLNENGNFSHINEKPTYEFLQILDSTLLTQRS